MTAWPCTLLLDSSLSQKHSFFFCVCVYVCVYMHIKCLHHSSHQYVKHNPWMLKNHFHTGIFDQMKNVYRCHLFATCASVCHSVCTSSWFLLLFSSHLFVHDLFPCRAFLPHLCLLSYLCVKSCTVFFVRFSDKLWGICIVLDILLKILWCSGFRWALILPCLILFAGQKEFLPSTATQEEEEKKIFMFA